MIGVSTNPNLPLVIPEIKTFPQDVGIEYIQPKKEYKYKVGWMYDMKTGPACVGETGFFFSSCHFDSRGIFNKSSLRHDFFIEHVKKYKPPYSFIDRLSKSTCEKSKFYQPVSVHWDGVVLATQVPKDRSITTVGKQEQWWDFYKRACLHYNKELFVKIHPWVKDDTEKQMIDVAKEHGCSYGKVGNGFLKTCRFVILYNSTYSVDCFLNGARVVQCAPGYFSDSGAVDYSPYHFPDEAVDRSSYGKQLIEWLSWNYCLYSKMKQTDWVSLFHWMAKNPNYLGVPEDFSYASRAISTI